MGKQLNLSHRQVIRKFGLISSGYDYGPVMEFCKYDHEHSGFI
jgi:hypothetical protein